MKLIYRFVRHALVAMLIAFSLISEASVKSWQMNRWTEMSSRQLLVKEKAYEQAMMPDSAIICCRIVSNRYDKGMDHNSKFLCLKAYVQATKLYFLVYQDYGKALESINAAREIMRESHIKEPYVDMYSGGIFSTVAKVDNDASYWGEAMKAYKRGFESAIRMNDGEVLDLIFTNMLILAKDTHCLAEMPRYWKQYLKFKRTRRSVFFDYNKLLYMALELVSQRQFAAGIRLFKQQIKLLQPVSKRHARLAVQAYSNAMECYAATGEYESAMAMSKYIKGIADLYRLHDVELDLAKAMSKYSAALGEMELSKQYLLRYYEIKDSVLNLQNLKAVVSTDLRLQLRDIDREMAHVKQRNMLQSLLTIVIAIIATCIAGFMYVLYRKNRKLKEKNVLLYEQYQILLREEHPKESTSSYTDLGEEETCTSGIQPVSCGNRRYKSSKLTEAEKDAIFSKVLTSLATPEIIQDPNLSLESVASLIGSKPRHVSQVINERCNRNFKSLVNEYKIREICMRMSDWNRYGHLTIEAIASEMGFKSRSNFAVTFRKFTGLNPSEYQKIAREKSGMK